MSNTDFHFAWDTAKAIANFRKHGVRFEESMAVFEDPRATADERRQYESGKYRIQEAAMKSEYDFSNAERGKFYREGARLIGPVHVAADVVAQLSRVAAVKGITSSDLANEILRRALAEMDAAAKVG